MHRMHRPGFILGWIATIGGNAVSFAAINKWFTDWNATLQGLVFLGTLFITVITIWRTLFGKRGGWLRRKPEEYE